MAFTCNLYKISDPPYQLNKDIISAGKLIRENIPCSPFEPLGDLKGNIIIDYSFNADAANYCSITESSGGETPVTRTRYAFITDRIKGVGGRLTLVLEEDPLMTFKARILNLDILVERCTKQAQIGDPAGYNSLLPDSRVPVTSQAYYREFVIPGLNFEYPTNYASSANQYVLGVIG